MRKRAAQCVVFIQGIIYGGSQGQNTSQNPKTLHRIQKHFPESKNISQNRKHFPESKNTSQNRKHFPESRMFWILGRVFGFWEVFLDSGPCFWILRSVLSRRATVIMSSFYKDFGSVRCNSIRILGFFFPPFQFTLYFYTILARQTAPVDMKSLTSRASVDYVGR